MTRDPDEPRPPVRRPPARLVAAIRRHQIRRTRYRAQLLADRRAWAERAEAIRRRDNQQED